MALEGTPQPITLPAGEHEGLKDLLDQIIQGGVGARSRWAMRAAADAAGTEGVGGVIVIQIPPKCKDYVDVTFTIGVVEVVSRWAV